MRKSCNKIEINLIFFNKFNDKIFKKFYNTTFKK